MKKKILFIVNGLGLGNSTRCHAIMEYLYKIGYRIDVVTSQNGLWYFADKKEVSEIFEISPINYSSKNGKISIFKTILATLKTMYWGGGK